VAAVAAAVLGAVLMASGGAKLASRSWPQQAGELGAPPWSVPVVPWVELAVGALLVVQLARPLVALVAVALIAVFTVVLVVRLAQGRHPPCACFGRFSARPIGPWSVVRNVVLIGLAALAAAG
jgi:uncharacterized membrane protein YphA (DoxX/SURF4 family)